MLKLFNTNVLILPKGNSLIAEPKRGEFPLTYIIRFAGCKHLVKS